MSRRGGRVQVISVLIALFCALSLVGYVLLPTLGGEGSDWRHEPSASLGTEGAKGLPDEVPATDEKPAEVEEAAVDE
ncbi:MAG: hypothetical protein V3T24_07820 [Longimicrobiales bacterium]